jgi:heme/copper-type cytochrome/quinol oxidase subunit 1
MSAVYRFWVSLMTAAVVLQIGFAGYGAFRVAHKLDKKTDTVNQDTFDNAFTPHAALGDLIVLSGLVLLVLALLARGRDRIKWSAIAFVLLVAQLLLAWTGATAPYILGALHPINALLILGVLGSITMREWKGGRGMGMHADAAPPAA